MNGLFAIAALSAVLAFCNLGDALKESSQTPREPAKVSEPSPTKKPLDKETVKNELLSLENKLTEAAMNGDITMLAQNTTDDFVLTDVDGKVQDKNKALADIKQEKTIRSWAITDADLISFSEDSAVLQYVLNVTLKSGASGRARVTDSFVRKDGKWLVKSEQQTMIK